MTPETEIAVVRRAYARQIAHKAGIDDVRLERALAEVPREAFLGPGPWHHSDAVLLYQDALERAGA